MPDAAIGFLHSLAHALASMQLYGAGHPARSRVVDVSFGRLHRLMLIEGTPAFSFIEGTVIHGALPLHELRDWPWARRLSALGAQRLEFDGAVSRDSYGAFLDDLVERVVADQDSEAPFPPREGIRCGQMRVIGANENVPDTEGSPAVATMPYRLGEESEAVKWLYEQAATRHRVPMNEVEAVVRSLTVAMHADGRLVVPLLQFSDKDQYSALHAINVSVLAMTMSETLGMSSRDIRAFGIAGLLHDIGMTQVPNDLLRKPSLTPADWEVVHTHPVAGAKMLLQRSEEHEIAAVAAYEHHSRPDGGGYPRLRTPRDHHYVSKVIAVCDAYDALRAPKAYRNAWTQDESLHFLERNAGSQFDHNVAVTFVAMMRRLRGRMLLLPDASAPRLSVPGTPPAPLSTASLPDAGTAPPGPTVTPSMDTPKAPSVS